MKDTFSLYYIPTKDIWLDGYDHIEVEGHDELMMFLEAVYPEGDDDIYLYDTKESVIWINLHDRFYAFYKKKV